MKVAYTRVSSEEQNLDRQLTNLRKFGAGNFYKKEPGTSAADREEFQNSLEYVRFGDIFMVEAID